MRRSSESRRRVSPAIVLACFLPVAAAASDPIRLTSGVYQEQEIVDGSGLRKVKQVPASTLQPGSELVYVVSYANVSDKPARIVITNPLPADLGYRSASGALDGTQSDVSVDGGKTYGPLASLMVNGGDGTVRPATAADITHVRWTVPRPVRPGEQGRVSLRAVLK